MTARDRQIRLILSDEEMKQLRQLAEAHDRSMNSYLRALLRQAVNKSLIELPAKEVKAEAELV